MLINTQTLDLLSEQEYRNQNMGSSLPVVLTNETLLGTGYTVVSAAQRPEFDPVVQRLEPGEPNLVDGVWRHGWRVVEIYGSETEKEQALYLAEVEARRSATPRAVLMVQARLALHAKGLLSGVAAALATMPSPQREAAEIEWEFRQTVERDSELAGALAAMLGLNDSQLDDLFISASSL